MYIKQLLVSSHAYLGQVLCGYMMGCTSFLLTKLLNPNETPLPDTISSSEATSLTTFSFYPMLLGILVSGYLSNIMGRKLCLMLGGSILVLGHTIPLIYLNLSDLKASRAVSGFGMGIILNVIVVYLTEIASNNIRGSTLAMIQIFTNLGTVLPTSIGKYMSVLGSYYIGLAIALAFTVGAYFIPESPIFALIKGKDDEATAILNTLGRSDDQKQLILNEDKKINYLKLVTVKKNLKTLFILNALFAFQYNSGFIALYFYSPQIISLVNINLNPFTFFQYLALASSCVTLIFINRVGRRILLVFSCGFCCIFQMLMGLYLFLENGDYSVTEHIQWLPFVAMIGFFLFYFSGLSIVPTILTGEMLPSNIRSFGTAIFLMGNWLMGHKLFSLHILVVEILGKYASFFVYSVVCLAGAVFSLMLTPETKGKSFVEIQLMLNK